MLSISNYDKFSWVGQFRKYILNMTFGKDSLRYAAVLWILSNSINILYILYYNTLFVSQFVNETVFSFQVKTNDSISKGFMFQSKRRKAFFWRSMFKISPVLLYKSPVCESDSLHQGRAVNDMHKSVPFSFFFWLSLWACVTFSRSGCLILEQKVMWLSLLCDF